MSISQPKSRYEWLSSFWIVYDFKFDPIISYLTESNKMLQELNKDLQTDYLKWEEKKAENADLPDAFDVYESDILTIGEFGSILHNSIFLSIYSVFENEFFNLCLRCKEFGSFKLGPNDLNGASYIHQNRMFLTKVMNVNLDSLNSEWEKIQKYRMIRNSITHKDGIIVQPEDNFILFIEQTNGVNFNSEKNIVEIYSIDFLMNFIDLIKSFLSGVCNEIIRQKE